VLAAASYGSASQPTKFNTSPATGNIEHGDGLRISGEPTMEDEKWQEPQAYFRAAI
jgi:hypothetical protein